MEINRVNDGDHSPVSAQNTPFIRGTGVILALPSTISESAPLEEVTEARYLFFRRSNHPGIPYPGRIALIGGRSKPEEDPVTTACREISEELFFNNTEVPLRLRPTQLRQVATIPDDRPGQITVFEAELCVEPEELKMLEDDKPMQLVTLNESEILNMVFPYTYTRIIHEVVKRRQAEKAARMILRREGEAVA